MLYAYLRVSAKDQNVARQIKALKEYRPDLLEDSVFIDKQSGKDFVRTGYCHLKEKLQSGDELVIKELDRLGRNKIEIQRELTWFKEHGIAVRILNVPTTLIEYPKGQEWVMEMVNNVLIEVMGAVAENEREKILERQKEGVAAMPIVDGKRVSLKTGNAIGRKNIAVPQFAEYHAKAQRGEMSVIDCCTALGINRAKWYRLCKAIAI